MIRIAIEGINGAGKTTLFNELINYYLEEGYVLDWRIEPGNDEIIDLLKKYGCDDEISSLLFAVDRLITENRFPEYFLPFKKIMEKEKEKYDKYLETNGDFS